MLELMQSILLHGNSQIHALVNSAIEVERACCSKRCCLLRIASTKTHLNVWRAWFRRRFCCRAVPRAIRNYVRGGRSVNQSNALAFLNRDGLGYEV